MAVRTWFRSCSHSMATRSIPRSTASRSGRPSCGESKTPAHGPRSPILIDHYEENWGRLWWIRLRGRARVLDKARSGSARSCCSSEKYPQYRSEPPDGPVLAVDVTDVREWAS